MYDQLKERVAALNGMVQAIEATADTARRHYESTKVNSDISAAALDLAHKASAERGDTQKNLATLATLSLQAARGPDYVFRFDPAPNGKGVVPVIQEKSLASSPQRFGGAARAFCGSGLRIATTVLHPKLAPLMVLDEPNRNASFGAYNQWHTWLGLLAEKVGLQVFLVSHHIQESDEIDLPNTQIFKVSRTSTWSTVSPIVKESGS
jgi:hypothetical protein